eukprot:3829064-Rhodomonas_salina.3
MSTLAAIHAYTAVSDMYNDFSNPMNLANVVKLCTSCALSYMFSRPRLTSFARAFFWAIVGAWRYLSPTVLVVQACLPGADKLKYFILTVCSALIFPLVWPRWLGTTVRVILMGWVPFTWNLYQNDSDGRKVRMVEFGLGYFVVSILGPAYGAWIAVHRRKAWLAQLKEAKQSSSKPSAKVDDAKQTAEEKTARNEVRAIRARRRCRADVVSLMEAIMTLPCVKAMHALTLPVSGTGLGQSRESGARFLRSHRCARTQVEGHRPARRTRPAH